jgi:hypothetical protein
MNEVEEALGYESKKSGDGRVARIRHFGFGRLRLSTGCYTN